MQPEIIPAVPDTVFQTVTAEPEKKMFLGIDWNNPQHLLYVILGLGILFLAALLFALLRKPKKKETLPGMYPPGYEGMNIPNMPMQGGQKEPEAPKGPSAKELARFEENKTFIANNCISKPKIVANVVSKWIAEDEEQGVVKAVRSFVSVDDKLIQILRPHMDATTFEMLNYGWRMSKPRCIKHHSTSPPLVAKRINLIFEDASCNSNAFKICVTKGLLQASGYSYAPT